MRTTREAGEVGLGHGGVLGEAAGDAEGSGEGRGPHHAGRLWASSPLNSVSGSVSFTASPPPVARSSVATYRSTVAPASRRNAICVASGDQAPPHDWPFEVTRRSSLPLRASSTTMSVPRLVVLVATIRRPSGE